VGFAAIGVFLFFGATMAGLSATTLLFAFLGTALGQKAAVPKQPTQDSHAQEKVKELLRSTVAVRLVRQSDLGK